MNEQILQEIGEFCRARGLAESTFGRRAVNDGKLASRLRNGGRITTDTLDRIRSFMARNADAAPARRRVLFDTSATSATLPVVAPPAPPVASGQAADDPQRNFRFFDNRQKYLLFVNTCSEKWEIANRVGLELANIHPRPPAVRVFDAGVGDGTVLARVMRNMHDRFPTMPFYIVGKEISLEDIRLTLNKMADRFIEHPSTVLVLTNLAYSEAPWLAAKSLSAATSLVWKEVAMEGNSAHAFEKQITELEPFLAENWKARVSPKSGNPVYERPVILVIYRNDHKFLLDQIVPKPGGSTADYDLVIASQPYRARSSLEFKAKRVLAPLARALGPGGRMIAIHSYGHDPGMEIIQKIWPNDNPFIHSRHDLLKEVKHELGAAGRDLNFNAYSDQRSLFRYDMHTLPSEISPPPPRSAPPRCSPPGTRRSTWRRSRTTACRRATATRATSRRRARCCKSTADCGSTTNPSSSRTGANSARLRHARRFRANGSRSRPRGRARLRSPRWRTSCRAARRSTSRPCRPSRRPNWSPPRLRCARPGSSRSCTSPRAACRAPPICRTCSPACAGEADVRRLLVIGGDVDAPGPLPDALSVIQKGRLREAGIEEIGIGAYPEGHPRIPSGQAGSRARPEDRQRRRAGPARPYRQPILVFARAHRRLAQAVARRPHCAAGESRARRSDQRAGAVALRAALRRQCLAARAGVGPRRRPDRPCRAGAHPRRAGRGRRPGRGRAALFFLRRHA